MRLVRARPGYSPGKRGQVEELAVIVVAAAAIGTFGPHSAIVVTDLTLMMNPLLFGAVHFVEPVDARTPGAPRTNNVRNSRSRRRMTVASTARPRGMRYWLFEHQFHALPRAQAQ